MKSQDLKKHNLPDKPGVYFFKRGTDILYIGKATSLKSRVRSYFSNDLIQTRGPIITDMVFRASGLDWQVTDTVLEALILEANLIKKYQPIANTKEKDDKSFNYVCISKEVLPKILVIRGKNLEKNKYKNVFGPFTNGGQLKEALKIIRKIFPFIDDKTKNYNEFYRQIGLAPLLGEEGVGGGDFRKKYLNNIKNIVMFFEGRKGGVLKNLEKQMKALAKEQKFEDANAVKRQIFALKHINDVALIKEDQVQVGDFSASSRRYGVVRDEQRNLQPTTFRIEAYDIAHMSGKNMVGVMTVIENGEVNKNEYKKFKIKTQDNTNDTGALAEILERRFAHSEWKLPSMIVLDGSTAQINVTNKILKEKNIPVHLVSVVKDDGHRVKEIKGEDNVVKKYKGSILLANSEAHRFAITYHKQMRGKSFLSK